MVRTLQDGCTGQIIGALPKNHIEQKLQEFM